MLAYKRHDAHLQLLPGVPLVSCGCACGCLQGAAAAGVPRVVVPRPLPLPGAPALEPPEAPLGLPPAREGPGHAGKASPSLLLPPCPRPITWPTRGLLLCIRWSTVVCWRCTHGVLAGAMWVVCRVPGVGRCARTRAGRWWWMRRRGTSGSTTLAPCSRTPSSPSSRRPRGSRQASCTGSRLKRGQCFCRPQLLALLSAPTRGGYRCRSCCPSHCHDHCPNHFPKEPLPQPLQLLLCRLFGY